MLSNMRMGFIVQKDIILFLIAILVSQNIHSQDGKQASYTSLNIVYEKIYLHIDREVYSPGDDLWFKAYLVSGINNRLLKGYKNIYVQLVDTTSKVLKEILLLSENGIAAGDFKIPNHIEPGKYVVRAYTKYQQNFGNDSYYHKQIRIGSFNTKDAKDQVVDTSLIDLSFYPESGDLVYNAKNCIAFKAMNSKGRGINASGIVMNDLGDTVTFFQTKYLGMGSFYLMPNPERKYFALLNGFPQFRYEFEDIRRTGISMHFADSNEDAILTLARNYADNSNLDLDIIAYHKGVRLFKKKLTLKEFSETITISKSEFPLGISKISVCNNDSLILAERIIFINTVQENHLVLKPDRKSYTQRDSVKIEILLNNKNLLFKNGGLSLAVINKNYLFQRGYSGDIQSYLLLDSELKGSLESPASFFINDVISSPEKINLLLMVQGWRSYLWPQIISNFSRELLYWDDYGLSIQGYVKGLFKDKPVRNGSVSLWPLNMASTFMDTTTDETGHFKFENLFIQDSATITLEARREDGRRNTEILLKYLYTSDTIASDFNYHELSMLIPEISRGFYQSNYSRLSEIRKYAIESGSNWIEEVTITEEIPLNFGDFIRGENLKMYGTPDKSIKITEDDMAFYNLLDYLEANPVSGVRVMGDQISIRGGGTPLFLVDDIAIRSEDAFRDMLNIPMSDIDYIDFMISGAKSALFGSEGAEGAILIYTKIGELSTREHYVKGRISKTVEGFYNPRKFYSPKYEWINPHNPKPDYRPTLHWEPFVFLDKDSFEVKFFTSDFLEDYYVFIQGISDDGVIVVDQCEIHIDSEGGRTIF